jgi:hypothetical protein
MKFINILACLLIGAIGVNASETWSFSEKNGSPLAKAKSDAGTSFAGNSPIAKVKGGSLELSADGKTESTFRISGFAKPATSGKIEVSWTYTSADFSKTAAAGGSGNAGFDLRDINKTRNSPKDDTIHVAVRLRFQKNQLLLQYADTANIKKWITLKRIKGNSLDKPMTISLVANLNKGALSISANGEELAANARIAKGKPVSGFRIAQQTINGGNSWLPGDSVSVDNFSITKID